MRRHNTNIKVEIERQKLRIQIPRDLPSRRPVRVVGIMHRQLIFVSGVAYIILIGLDVSRACSRTLRLT